MCWKVRNSSFNTLHGKNFSNWRFQWRTDLTVTVSTLRGLLQGLKLMTYTLPCIKKVRSRPTSIQWDFPALSPPKTKKDLIFTFVMQVINESDAAVCRLLIMMKYGYKTGFNNNIYITTHSAAALLSVNRRAHLPSGGELWPESLWEQLELTLKTNWRNFNSGESETEQYYLKRHECNVTKPLWCSRPFNSV